MIGLAELLPPRLLWDASRQLHDVLRALPDAPDGCTPGQLVIAAAVFTEAAEAKTREAEACTICPDWPGLCATCQLLTGDAVAYRELAREVTPWASTSGCLVGGCGWCAAGQALAATGGPPARGQ